MNSTSKLPPGPLIVDVAGLTLCAEDKELISHPLTGGIVLFSRNYHSLEQLQQLTQEIRHSRNGPLLISVDQEGGRVQRFVDNFTTIPAMRRFGQHYDADPRAAVGQLSDAATLLAWELRRADVDFSFAPVADIDRDLCPAIGDRALHPTVDGATTLAKAVIEGFARAGCSSVIKHFPGHGSVAVDTHIGFAHDQRPMAEIQAQDMKVFANLSAHADAVMPAHVVYDQVDELPASLSSIWQRDILRGQLQFQGAIISDDLSMGAVSELMPPAQAAAMALDAGTDLVLICNNRQSAAAAYDHADIQVGDAKQIERRLALCAKQVQPPAATLLAAAALTIAAMA